jgi:raffinose/stachyose/melibiose transport system permease protein
VKRTIESQERSKKSLGRRSAKIIANAFLMLYALTALYPPIWMFYNSIKTQKEFALNIFSFPMHPHFSNYIKIFERATIFRAMFNSIFASTFAIVFIVALSFIVGYVFARYTFKGRRFLYFFFMFGLLVPVHALLIPVFIQFKTIGMLNNQFTIIPPLVVFNMPIAIFLVEGFVTSIPESIEESAFIDGSNHMNTLLRIVFPICSPIISTVVIMSFLTTWNEFGFPLVLIRDPKLRTIPLWLRTFSGQYEADYTGLMSAMLLASIPAILLYVFFHERIMRGMSAGAIKG